MPNKPTLVRTNSTPGSIKIVKLKVLTFHELWDAYPDKEDPFVDPKTGKKPPYADNQCAIRLSMTMHNVGVEMKSFRGEGQIRIDGKRTALRAREMADWLRLRPFAGLPVPIEVTGPNWQDHIRGRTGIVTFPVTGLGIRIASGAPPAIISTCGTKTRLPHQVSKAGQPRSSGSVLGYHERGTPISQNPDRFSFGKPSEARSMVSGVSDYGGPRVLVIGPVH